MKVKAILLLVIVAISLSACADASVSYTLSDDNSVNINYSVTFSSGGEDVSRNISLIKTYWTDMGFAAEDSENNGVFTLNGDKNITSDSRGNAVKELSSILTDKDSLFYNVNFNYTPSYFEDIYDFSANISLADLIRKNEGNSIPAAEIEAFLASAKGSEYKLSITLPGEVQETNADERSAQTCTWLLKYGETRQLKLVAKRVFEENVSHYANLNEAQNRDNLLFIVGCGIAGLALILIIIVIAVRKARKSGISEINVKRF